MLDIQAARERRTKVAGREITPPLPLEAALSECAATVFVSQSLCVAGPGSLTSSNETTVRLNVDGDRFVQPMSQSIGSGNPIPSVRVCQLQSR
jgi:hypothetical protein